MLRIGGTELIEGHLASGTPCDAGGVGGPSALGSKSSTSSPDSVLEQLLESTVAMNFDSEIARSKLACASGCVAARTAGEAALALLPTPSALGGSAGPVASTPSPPHVQVYLPKRAKNMSANTLMWPRQPLVTILPLVGGSDSFSTLCEARGWSSHQKKVFPPFQSCRNRLRVVAVRAVSSKLPQTPVHAGPGAANV